MSSLRYGFHRTVRTARREPQGIRISSRDGGPFRLRHFVHCHIESAIDPNRCQGSLVGVGFRAHREFPGGGTVKNLRVSDTENQETGRSDTSNKYSPGAGGIPASYAHSRSRSQRAAGSYSRTATAAF